MNHFVLTKTKIFFAAVLIMLVSPLALPPAADGQSPDPVRILLLETIPVVVLTTSGEQSDIEKCYSAGANSYICKPVDMTDFVEAIKCIGEYWFEVVRFPKAE